VSKTGSADLIIQKLFKIFKFKKKHKTTNFWCGKKILKKLVLGAGGTTIDCFEAIFVELVSKELNHFGAIALFFRDWAPRDTDRWYINLPLCATCQCPWCPISEKRRDCPKVIQLLGH
jgi:hypothetical protein